jgi:homoaconitate hydratase
VGQTVIEKIAEAHLADGPPPRPVRAGDFVSIRPDRVMTHDNTAAVMNKFATIGAGRFHDPGQVVFTLDHDIQNRSEANLAKYADIEAFACKHGVDFYPAGTGIGHQIMVEKGYVVPGSFVVASDSHSNMYGAMSALGTPVVRTDAAAVWAVGNFWWQIPRTVRVELTGSLKPGVAGKDVIIALCGVYNCGEVLNAAVEFGGDGVASLSLESRLTIANMTTEWGPLVGWFPCDETTLAYLDARRRELEAGGIFRIREDDIESWRKHPPLPDHDAVYAAVIELDLGSVTPHVLGPDTVQDMTPLHEMAARNVPIHKAYLVSCVNSRVEDLEQAARVLRGKRVADSVEFYLAAASSRVEAEAAERGIWQVLVEAGAKTLPPGCGPCIGLGTGLLEPGEIGISATNRNFKGRMGSRDAQCYLASPAVVAASAVRGTICGPEEWDVSPIDRRIEISPAGESPEESVEILDGFPERISGRLVFVDQDNLNTDGIYGKDYTYREDMTPEMMAGVVMQNYDPAFASRIRRGDVLVGGYNFGTGSSREQAATALIAAGIPVVVAGSYSQTYLRNAFNNGFPCIESPRFVDALREAHGDHGEKTLIPRDAVDVDFSAGRIRWREEAFPFPPLGPVPQSLVVAGGVENLVKIRLNL